MFPVLETERLRLREVTLEDADGLFACFSNDQVTRYYGQEPLQHIEQAEKLVEHFANLYNDTRGIRWGIERKEIQGIIGTLGYHAWSPKHKRAEIGYEVHPSQWGQGFATEALSKALAYGFEVMELIRISAVVYTRNEASQQLLVKAGFQKEGLLRKYMFQNGAAHDTYIYSLLREDFSDTV
ncbi:GNAT family N-acetyltransferase [Paenibacillus sp. CAA11]|uniref:GNAT family N-acetyltransferase n=1 Tax=Paenibacillus sp. CAA11 TaxID=1532905 RepID=UPI000D3DC808|nr:GNAT family protein [Paenibacillus sp. CAA11]AWB45594.1 GNAT family N-acetyltransferase [Paenibacillus sp. CAA11]